MDEHGSAARGCTWIVLLALASWALVIAGGWVIARIVGRLRGA
jgi:hypothetical protein